MKFYVSCDIEGINGITSWSETEKENPDYSFFQKQLSMEVKSLCDGLNKAMECEIFIKDAHDSARNIDPLVLPNNITLHRGWEGGLCSMMAGLTKDYDGVLFVGYHSASKSPGNPLAHTMNTQISHVKINNEIASEFLINSLYASMLGVPVIFLSGDYLLTENCKLLNDKIFTVATKEGRGGAVISKHPNVTNKMIEENAFQAALNVKKIEPIPLPKEFEIEIEYKTAKEAFSASFFPGVILSSPTTIYFKSSSYLEVLTVFKFLL